MILDMNFGFSVIALFVQIEVLQVWFCEVFSLGVRFVVWSCLIFGICFSFGIIF